MSRSQKGSQFERSICRELSNWWMPGRDDIFWRATTSGARATSRAKQGKRTAGSDGDITAIDPVGQPFLDLITPELKRGYNKHTMMDLLDAPAHSTSMQKWEQWIEQARTSHENAGSFSWMILAKRDQREPVVLMPRSLYGYLFTYSPIKSHQRMCFDMESTLLNPGYTMILWKTWLTHVTPQRIKEVVKLV